MTPEILIIGGGISGLCLAHGLRKHGISFHIYEKDSSDDYRAQGYRIRIAGTGSEALRYLLDNETMALFELTCAEMKLGPLSAIDAVTGEPIKSAGPGPMSAQPPSAGPPAFEQRAMPHTVDRTVFRQVLLRGLEKNISYGHALASYEIKGDGIKALFTNGEVADGSLLVGADGARSAVRNKFLPNHGVVDTGGRMIYGKTPLTTDATSALCALLLNGMSAVKELEKPLTVIAEPVVFPNRNQMEAAGIPCPVPYLYWVAAGRSEVFGWQDNAKLHLTSEEAEKLALDISSHWNPTVRAMMERQAPGQTSVLPVYSITPDVTPWKPNPRVTLVGDAVHLMSPAGGQGANTALRDVHTLCQFLVEDGLSREAIARYEVKMRDYTRQAIEQSFMGSARIFGGKPWQDCKAVSI